MDLDHNFPAGHRVVMHFRVEISETAGWEISHLGFVKPVPHSDFEA